MSLTRTFQARADLEPKVMEVFAEFSKYFAHIKHSLFAAIASGKKANSLKNEYVARYEITARQFNAIKNSLEGKISSIKELRAQQIKDKKERIDSLKKKIQRLTKSKKREQIHQKKRRLAKLEQEWEKLKQDHKEGIVRLCFGTKKLFRAQFNLEANGYSSHEEWLMEWTDRRSKELYFLGSHEETSGNQSCTATLEDDDTISLRIRLPNALAAKHGKYLKIATIRFEYGKEELFTALKNCLNKSAPQAFTWRFVKDKKGWRFLVSFNIQKPSCISTSPGAIGLDINADHLALTETDTFGNPIDRISIPCHLKNKDHHQAKATIGDAVAQAVAWAETRTKSIVVEQLDFQKKKCALRENPSAKHAKMLSSFAYQSTLSHIRSRALRKGIAVNEVNPAFTSFLGRLKYARRYGLTIHESAALVIARRFLGVSEKLFSGQWKVPTGKDAHVTFFVPARNQSEHVWSFWRKLSKKLQAALKAHFQAAKSRSSSFHMEACRT